MSILLKQLMKELDDVSEKIEREVKVVLFNGVGVAQLATTRVDTGFFKNNWFFSRKGDIPEIKNDGTGIYPSKAGLTMSNLKKWNFGQDAFIVNNTNYASYHDVGTIYMTPLFISFQVETYLEKQLSKIKI